MCACFLINICHYVDMDCPFCGSSQIKVSNSRSTAGGLQIWRRRKCVKCGNAFTSYETMYLSYLIVVKKSGRHQKFSRAKLYSGIYNSFLDKKGVDRGDMARLAEEITDEIEKKIIKLKRKKINSSEIENEVLKILAKKAPDAFLRFLAYREGENLKKISGCMRNDKGLPSGPVIW